MKKTHEMISELAYTLDQQHKPSETITVRGTRASLLRYFKPKKRGGQLYAGSHPLAITKKAKAIPLDQIDLLA